MRIFELRRNPDVNLKKTTDETLRDIASQLTQEELSRHFVHFSNIMKLGLKPLHDEQGTPTGIYAYPLKYVIEEKTANIPYGNDRKYVFVFKATDDIKITTENNYTEADYKRDKKRLQELTSEEVFEEVNDFIEHMHGSSDFLLKIYKFTVKVARVIDVDRKEQIWNHLLRKLGFDAIVDYEGEGNIYIDEPTQALFLSRKGIEIVSAFQNRLVINPNYYKERGKNFTIKDWVEYVKQNPNAFKRRIVPDDVLTDVLAEIPFMIRQVPYLSKEHQKELLMKLERFGLYYMAQRSELVPEVKKLLLNMEPTMILKFDKKTKEDLLLAIKLQPSIYDYLIEQGIVEEEPEYEQAYEQAMAAHS